MLLRLHICWQSSGVRRKSWRLLRVREDADFHPNCTEHGDWRRYADKGQLKPAFAMKTRPMTRKPPKRGLPPMHPGELLRDEILPALDRSKAEIARLLGVSRQTLYDVLKEKQPV